MEYYVKQELNKPLKDLLERFARYKYAMLILLFGVVLMILPIRKKSPAPKAEQTTICEEQSLEERLEQLLQKMEGAGRVEVLLTLDQGSCQGYQTDTRQKRQPEYEETERKTVLASNGHGEDIPIVTSSRYPLYRGAVVVCQGADRPTVKLNIVRAVSSATGLSSDKISVIKMSGN